jgi:hypothetical protein
MRKMILRTNFTNGYEWFPIRVIRWHSCYLFLFSEQLVSRTGIEPVTY